MRKYILISKRKLCKRYIILAVSFLFVLLTSCSIVETGISFDGRNNGIITVEFKNEIVILAKL